MKICIPKLKSNIVLTKDFIQDIKLEYSRNSGSVTYRCTLSDNVLNYHWHRAIQNIYFDSKYVPNDILLQKACYRIHIPSGTILKLSSLFQSHSNRFLNLILHKKNNPAWNHSRQTFPIYDWMWDRLEYNEN